MAKRPLRRFSNRQAVEPVLFSFPAEPEPDTAASGAGQDVGDPEAADGAGASPIASREQFAQLLGQIREQGGIDVGDEAAVLREYDVLLAQLRGEKQRLHDEYRDRLARDGQDATEAWLAEAAAVLGRQQGEQMRRMLETVPGLVEGMADASSFRS